LPGEKNKIIHYPDALIKIVNEKHLLLDTSFFIDAMYHKDAFDGFAKECKVYGATLVTIQPVLIEFARGAKSKSAFSNRVSLVEDYVDGYIIPISPKAFSDDVPFLVEGYGQAGARVSLTDFLLAATAKQHTNDLFLLTKNSLDFPEKFFQLETYFLLQNQMSRTTQCYCIYRYSTESLRGSETLLNDEIPF